ncbi:DUF6494 family protein [Alphaproteobacteria bacterium LSUCC0684]
MQKNDMNDDAYTMAIRKFLKQLGVTTHQELEKAMAGIEPGAELPITATISIPELNFTHEVSATLIGPDRG